MGGAGADTGHGRWNVSEVHDDAIRSLQILRRSLRAMKITRFGHVTSMEDSQEEALVGLEAAVRQHEALDQTVA